MTLKEAYSFLARRQAHFESNSDLYKKELIESHNIAIIAGKQLIGKKIVKRGKNYER